MEICEEIPDENTSETLTEQAVGNSVLDHTIATESEQELSDQTQNEGTEQTNDIAHRAEGRPRKRKADPNQWRKNVNENKRSKGQPYMDKKYEKGSKKFEMVEKPGKMLGERCH